MHYARRVFIGGVVAFLGVSALLGVKHATRKPVKAQGLNLTYYDALILFKRTTRQPCVSLAKVNDPYALNVLVTNSALDTLHRFAPSGTCSKGRHNIYQSDRCVLRGTTPQGGTQVTFNLNTLRLTPYSVSYSRTDPTTGLADQRDLTLWGLRGTDSNTSEPADWAGRGAVAYSPYITDVAQFWAILDSPQGSTDLQYYLVDPDLVPGAGTCNAPGKPQCAVPGSSEATGGEWVLADANTDTMTGCLKTLATL